MEYILLIHKDAESVPEEEEWTEFFARANASGTFRGGSAFGGTQCIGKKEVELSTERLGGFMRFDSEEPKKIEAILAEHPVVKHGGTVELIELPKNH